jgi:hypothetical protein
MLRVSGSYRICNDGSGVRDLEAATQRSGWYETADAAGGVRY